MNNAQDHAPQDLVDLWLAEFAQAEGLSGLRLDARGLAGLKVDDALEVEIEVPGQAPLVYLRAGLAALPHRGREACLARLLARNFLLDESAGAAFGIDPDRDWVTLSLCQPIACLDAMDFANLLRNFIGTALQWQERLVQELQEHEATRRPDAGELPGGPAFTRV